MKLSLFLGAAAGLGAVHAAEMLETQPEWGTWMSKHERAYPSLGEEITRKVGLNIQYRISLQYS